MYKCREIYHTLILWVLGGYFFKSQPIIQPPTSETETPVCQVEFDMFWANEFPGNSPLATGIMFLEPRESFKKVEGRNLGFRMVNDSNCSCSKLYDV